jgi:hypothetical protein
VRTAGGSVSEAAPGHSGTRQCIAIGDQQAVDVMDVGFPTSRQRNLLARAGTTASSSGMLLINAARCSTVNTGSCAPTESSCLCPEFILVTCHSNHTVISVILLSFVDVLCLLVMFYACSMNMYRRTSISGTTFRGKKCLSGTMLFDLTFPC